MWFNSFAFLIFLAVVMGVYACLRHQWQNRFLLLASYFFYGCWDWRFLFLILFTTCFDYLAARMIEQSADQKHRKRWVVASVVVDLSILGIFKYFGFFVQEFNRLLGALGLGNWEPGLNIILPVGISFYTFQALSYTIDVYRGRTTGCRHFLDFALYISFFPQLVAGPIERSHHLLPQVEQPRPKLNEERFRDGLYLILTGLFLKVVIADNMAWLANHVFTQPTEQLGGLDVLTGIYAFAFQIYGDFAGYSAIAIGVAKWLGFDLMENFRHPYFSRSPREFWQRWHISLSTWLRDYLYIPLGGNRGGKMRTARNLLITMLLGGLWHGASWNFIIWGGIHGLWLGGHRMWVSRFGERGERLGISGFAVKLLSWGVTFHLVCLGWLFFRADSLDHAFGLLSALSSGWGISDFVATSMTLIAFFVGPWLIFEWWTERQNEQLAMTTVHWGWRVCFYIYIILMLTFFPAPEATEFIYFQF